MNRRRVPRNRKGETSGGEWARVDEVDSVDGVDIVWIRSGASTTSTPRVAHSPRWLDFGYCHPDHMQFLPWLAFALAAIFEVGGDAVVRMGIKGNNFILMLLGAATLGGYGLIVNSVDWSFSKIFGVYVGAFALVAVLFGKFVFREQIPLSTWIGVIIILAGGMVIQFGK